MFRSLTPVLLVLALAPTSFAGTIKVPAQHDTIQAAVDAADPDDTIVVSAGIYTERIHIPQGKAGLSIVGKGKVFLDGYGGSPGDGAPEHGVTIQSSNITLSRLIIRHAEDDGIYASSVMLAPIPLSDLTFDRLTIINSGSAGIEANANGVTVSGCLLVGNHGGIRISGDDVHVLRTSIVNDGDKGLEIEGSDATVETSDFQYLDSGTGIYVQGPGALVKKCTVRVCGDNGIYLESEGGRIENCKVSDVRQVGIDFYGDGGKLLKNTVSGTASTGIDIEGDDLLVVSNSVSHVINDSDGIYAYGKNGHYEKNRVFGVSDTPFDLNVDGSVIIRNQAQDFGGEGDAGFSIEGNENRIERNTAKNGDSTGMRVYGSQNEILRNKLQGMTDNGLEVNESDSENNLLEGNIITNNQGDGIENGGVNTTVRGNRCRGNLQDVSNRNGDGANLIDGGGNAFTTGGLTVDPLVE
jgi:parallel beta-helix repeat protein